MTLNYGIDSVSIPGPSIVPLRVREAMARPMPSAVDAWEAPGGLSLNIDSPDHRSKAVTTVQTGDVDAARPTALHMMSAPMGGSGLAAATAVLGKALS